MERATRSICSGAVLFQDPNFTYVLSRHKCNESGLGLLRYLKVAPTPFLCICISDCRERRPRATTTGNDVFLRRYLAKDMPNLECKVTRANTWRADGEPLRVVGGLWRSRIVLKRGDGVLRMRLTLKCGEGQPGKA